MMPRMVKLTNGYLRKDSQGLSFVTEDGQSWDASFAVMTNSFDEVQRAEEVLASPVHDDPTSDLRPKPFLSDNSPSEG